MNITKKLDPRTWFTQPLETSNTSLAPANSTSVSSDNQPKDAEVVSGQFIPDITVNAQADALKHTERLRAKIESFDEDKQTPLEWFVVKFFTFLAYTLPIVVAYVVGIAIGEAWSGPFDWSKPFTVYSHVISVGMEMMIPVMGYAVTTSVKRAFKDRTQMAIPIVLGLVFFGLAVGNSFATMFLLEKHIDVTKADNAALASMYFRSFAPLIIDTIATIFLSVVTIKNLQKFLLEMQSKAQGIQQVSRAEIAVQAAFDQSAIDRENAKNEQERKRMDNELLRELTRRRNEDTLGESGRKGRYGGGW